MGIRETEDEYIIEQSFLNKIAAGSALVMSFIYGGVGYFVFPKLGLPMWSIGVAMVIAGAAMYWRFKTVIPYTLEEGSAVGKVADKPFNVVE